MTIGPEKSVYLYPKYLVSQRSLPPNGCLSLRSRGELAACGRKAVLAG